MSTFSRITERLLADAGLKPGMAVLDLGCGFGEVTRAVARRVGPEGRVVGLDANATTLAQAEATTRDEGLANVAFVRGDLASPDLPPASFDAVVGRRVLMYVPNLPAVLPGLVRLLKPGGVFAVQEHSRPRGPNPGGGWPFHEQAQGWLWRTVEREGADLGLGYALPGVLAEAGLSVEAVTAHAILAGYERGLHHSLPTLVAALRQRIVDAGVATEAELDLPTLEGRLEAERRANATVYVSDMSFGVVARRAGAP